MKKLISSVLFSVFGLFVLAGSVGAHVTGTMGFDAFRDACSGIGGTLTGTGSGATCTHSATTPFSVQVLEAGESGNAWTVSGFTSESHVSTWVNGAIAVQTSVTPGGSTVTSCLNPGGQAMSLDHQNCQLP